MAPSRRKGAGKAASAAAARREWKLGDLVLAKVKGFPAWPATVSEPEKWGYPADQKKVVVHFFGTEQIAFCNPVDVEEFTEEKKLTLLGKRHGKGADFVRAVNEIIVCFEKMKKQDLVGSENGTEETNISNENNSEESLTKSTKDEASLVRVKSFCAGATNDLNSLTEAAVAAAAEDALHDEGMKLEDAHTNVLFADTRVSTTYSTRSKTDVAKSQNSARRRISTRRLRSSSRIDASGVQNIMLPSISNTRSSRHSGTNASYDKSLRRSKRIMKSSDDSEGYDVDSPAFVSNDSIEENDSEIMTIDSDTPSFNDGSTVESHCKLLGVEPYSENIEGDAELCNRMDFQTNAVIVKKKRKPNRKRPSDDTVVVAKQKVDVSEAEMLKTECTSPSNNEKLSERNAMDDGDEHLPLVKRARVRMGRPSPTGDEVGTLVHKDIKMLQVHESLAIQSSEPLNCKVKDPGDVESLPIEGNPANLSLGETRKNFVDGEPALLPSNGSPAKKPESWEIRKNFVDDEAALPPSKRLHRALEAMSANVAEDSQKTSNYPTVNTPSNRYCYSSAESSELTMGNKAVIGLGSGPLENRCSGDSDSGASACAVSNKEMSETDSITVLLVSDCVKTCGINSSNPELCKDSIEHTEGSDLEGLKVSSLNDPGADLDEQQHLVKSNSPKIDEKVAHLDCNAPCFIMSPDHCKIEPSELKESIKESSAAILQMSSEFATMEEIADGSLNCDTRIQMDNAGDEGDEAHGRKHLSVAENNQDSQRSEVEKEACSSESKESKVMSSVTPVKVLTSGHHQHLLHSNSNSISDTHLEDRTVSVTQSSSSLTDGPESVARASPPSSSMCNISASDNNYLENNSSCSPDTQLHPEKAKLAGKSSSKGEALSSFEAIIRSLTRTKESIGRATRIAIDCAKSGFATKVVEILAQNLERESNSHKKVDLFFLVDSITQCSRGIKGDGGIYPSAIGALLPRLLLAAAPPGSISLENHRQCLKVLRVWQERKILPEPIIRHHIRELDSLCGSYPTGGSRRPLRNERAFDDPVREMEGMLVDEYGSNSSFQLPGFCMPPMLRDEDGGSDSDGESFEAVTPEHNTENLDGAKTLIPAVEKRSHILEDVDGELEMEDVAPCCEVEIISIGNIAGDHSQVSHHQSDNHYGASFTSQQSKDVLLRHSPLPRSPPHPLPSAGFPHAVLDSVSNGPNSSNLYPSSQNFDSNLPGSMAKQSFLPRIKSTTLDSAHHHVHDNKDFEVQVPRQTPDCNNACTFSDRPTFHLSGRGSDRISTDSAFSKGLHLRPPHPAPSNQFSYVQDQQIQSRRDAPPPSHPNRFHTRHAENGNFYRDRDRNKFVARDNIGECWRPPLPSISGPCYSNGARMAHAPMPYSGPPREPSSNNNRWNFPPRPMRQFNPHRPPSEGPIPVANRGPNLWRPR